MSHSNTANRVTSLVIKRSKWARKTKGVQKGPSLLENNEGNMCCLGFLAKACGIPTRAPGEEFVGLASPGSLANYKEIREEAHKWPPKLIEWERWSTEERGHSSVLTDDIITVNDNDNTTDYHKETTLTAIFANELGIELTFED